MTGTIEVVRTDPLAPLRSALLAAAHRDADEVLAAADRSAAGALDAARSEASALRDEARARGAADAAAILAGEHAHAARESRSIVLGQRRVAHDGLRRRARDAVSELRSDPTYPALLDRLRERAREALGPGALIREHDRGGVVAEAGTRRVEYTLDGLADSCLDRLGAQVEELWSE